jgi:hypothetical protein
VFREAGITTAAETPERSGMWAKVGESGMVVLDLEVHGTPPQHDGVPEALLLHALFKVGDHHIISNK